MTRKQLITKLLNRRRTAERARHSCRFQHLRDRAAGRLDVINWTLAALEVRRNREVRK